MYHLSVPLYDGEMNIVHLKMVNIVLALRLFNKIWKVSQCASVWQDKGLLLRGLCQEPVILICIDYLSAVKAMTIVYK